MLGLHSASSLGLMDCKCSNPFVNFSLRLRVYEWNLSFALQITFLWIPPMSFSHIEIEKVRIMGSSSFRLVACSIGPPNFASAVCFGHLKERLQTPIITPKCIPKRNKKQRYWRKCRTIMLLNFQNFQIQKITNLPPQMVLKWFFFYAFYHILFPWGHSLLNPHCTFL